jgi:4-hydroxybenzoyl-CoA thioesterase
MSYTRSIPVEFNHCDPAGIVFYPRYFEMTNSVVENFFAEEGGHSFARMMSEGQGVPTARLETNFHAPSRLGDRLDVTLNVTRIGGASYALDVHVHRSGEPLVRFRLVTATTDLDARRAIPIPDDLRAALSRYAAACGLAEAAARGEENAA